MGANRVFGCPYVGTCVIYHSWYRQLLQGSTAILCFCKNTCQLVKLISSPYVLSNKSAPSGVEICLFMSFTLLPLSTNRFTTVQEPLEMLCQETQVIHNDTLTVMTTYIQSPILLSFTINSFGLKR